MITLPAFNRINSWYLIVVLTAISFPWSERLSSIGIVLLLAHWLIDPELMQKFAMFKLRPTILICWSFFLIHLIGLIRTNDFAHHWQGAEVKLSLLILPFVFSTENYLNTKRTSELFQLFLVSCFLSFLYCFVVSYTNYHALYGMSAVIDRMNLSKAIMHPGYYSNYFALALVWCVFEFTDNKNLSPVMKIFMLLASVFLLIILLILISRTAILFLACLAIYFMWRTTHRIRNSVMRVMVFVVSMSALILLSSQIPSINFRIHRSLNESHQLEKSMTIGNATGSRMVAWNSEWTLIKAKWLLGYGTGTANAELQAQLIRDGYVQLAHDQMHTHNQYFHTWLDTGVIGLLILITLLIWCGLLFYQRKQQIGFWLVCLITLNCFTDDMLEIQAGIVFFVFFLTLFLYQKETNKYGPGYL